MRTGCGTVAGVAYGCVTVMDNDGHWLSVFEKLPADIPGRRGP